MWAGTTSRDGFPSGAPSPKGWRAWLKAAWSLFLSLPGIWASGTAALAVVALVERDAEPIVSALLLGFAVGSLLTWFACRYWTRRVTVSPTPHSIADLRVLRLTGRATR